MKESKIKKLSGRALGPIIKHAQKHRGESMAIAEALTKTTGQKQYRQNVEEWLHPDPEKRVEPRLGVALALFIIACKRIGISIAITSSGVFIVQPDGEPRKKTNKSSSKKTAKRT